MNLNVTRSLLSGDLFAERSNHFLMLSVDLVFIVRGHLMFVGFVLNFNISPHWNYKCILRTKPFITFVRPNIPCNRSLLIYE